MDFSLTIFRTDVSSLFVLLRDTNECSGVNISNVRERTLLIEGVVGRILDRVV